MESWNPASWRQFAAKQLPAYPDQAALEAMEERLAKYPPLVFAGEARRLKGGLALAAEGQAFVLQGGDCAESFDDFTANIIRDTFRVLLQMAVVLTFGGGAAGGEDGPDGRPVRQAALVRHRDAGRRDPAVLSRRHHQRPGFHGRGAHARPRSGWIQAYFQSAGTLNLLRAFATGGYADLHEVHRWNLGFVAALAAGRRATRTWPRASTRRSPSWQACGMTSLNHPADARDGLLHQPRGAAAALRAGADPRR